MSSSEIAVCLGELVIDTYLPPVNQSFTGGNALNVAVYLHAAGIPTAFAGFVGDDIYGQAGLQAMDQLQIDRSYARVRPGPTRETFIERTADGSPRFHHELMSPRLPFAPNDEMLAFARNQRLVHLNWLDDPLPYFDSLTGDGSPLLSFDFGERSNNPLIERALPSTHAAFFSMPNTNPEEATARAQTYFEHGPRVVVITLGKAGSLVYDGQARHYPGHAGLIVDTLGAGDAYIGGFLAGLLSGQPVEACVRAGTGAAATACTTPGGWPGAKI